MIVRALTADSVDLPDQFQDLLTLAFAVIVEKRLLPSTDAGISLPRHGAI